MQKHADVQNHRPNNASNPLNEIPSLNPTLGTKFFIGYYPVAGGGVQLGIVIFRDVLRIIGV